MTDSAWPRYSMFSKVPRKSIHQLFEDALLYRIPAELVVSYKWPSYAQEDIAFHLDGDRWEVSQKGFAWLYEEAYRVAMEADRHQLMTAT